VSGRDLAMTPRELKKWLRVYASKKTYCPAGDDAHTLGADPWIWVLAGHRAYVICEHCALGYCKGRNVIAPEEFPEITVARQWIADGWALTLAPGQEPLVDDDELLRRWAQEVRERISRCHTCGSTGESATVMVSVRNSRFVFSICYGCLGNGSEEPLDLRGTGVLPEVVDALSDLVYISLPLEQEMVQ
jgi:hypothetical protein